MIEEEKNSITMLKGKLLDSPAINSLKQELDIYDKFINLGWRVQHSPFYLDINSGKFREVDISARKFWEKNDDEDFSFGINFIIECKSITNYHIVVCNEQTSTSGRILENNWIGDDKYSSYQQTIELLQKHNVSDSDIQETLKSFNKHLYPEGFIRYIDYRLDSFEIPVFCSFRETNIGTTRDLESSVVWKAFQGLYSIINSYKAKAFDYIDYDLYDIDNEEFLSSYESRLDELKQSLILASNHFEIFHPVLVVEAKLWKLKNDNIEELKFCRLLFQESSGFDKWIDIVTFSHLDEYLSKSKAYDDFFTEKGFGHR